MDLMRFYGVIGALAGVVAAAAVLREELSPGRVRILREAQDSKAGTASVRFRSLVLLPLIVGLLFVVAWPIFGIVFAVAGLRDLIGRIRRDRHVSAVADESEESDECGAMTRTRPEWLDALDKEALGESMDLQAIERQEWIDDPESSLPPRPFGHLHSRWLDLREQHTEGDRLHPFAVTVKSNSYRCSTYEGYALVRNGRIVDAIACASKKQP